MLVAALFIAATSIGYFRLTIFVNCRNGLVWIFDLSFQSGRLHTLRVIAVCTPVAHEFYASGQQIPAPVSRFCLVFDGVGKGHFANVAVVRRAL